jgi:hypothetical protein
LKTTYALTAPASAAAQSRPSLNQRSYTCNKLSAPGAFISVIVIGTGTRRARLF